MIGGNTNAIFQVKSTGKNLIGESEKTWEDALQLTGWLDLANGDSTTTYNAKLQESTHVFLCDYDEMISVTTDNSRAIINGHIYEVTLIDDPMGMHQHLEIFLKYIGGGLGA